MTPAAPGVNGQPKSALDRTRGLVTPCVPVLLPLDQVSSNLQLVGVDVRALAGQLDVLHEEVIRIHANRGGSVFERGHRDRTALRVGGRAPGASAANVVRKGGVLLPLIRYVEDIRQGRRPSASLSAGRPRLRLPRCDRAILLETYLDVSV